MTALLVRKYEAPDCILGQLFVFDDTKMRLFTCFTLELPYRNNAKNVSCIPMGKYRMTPIQHNKFGHCLRLVSVKDRSGILIHAGNYPIDTKGCILPGLGFSFNNNICTNMVSNSKDAMSKLMAVVNVPIELTVTSVI